MKLVSLYRPLRISLLLCIAGISVTPAVHAAGLPVYDGIHTVQNVLTQLHNGALNTAEFGKQAARWAAQNKVNVAQLEQIARQLVGVSSFSNLRPGQQPTFQPRPVDQDVDRKCSQSIARGLSGGFSISPSGSSSSERERQTELCRLRVAAENLQFNSSVALLERLRARSAQFEQLDRARARVGTSTGELQANDNDVARFMAATTGDMNEWAATNQAFELYLAEIKQQQQLSAKAQLQGVETVGAAVIKTLTLKAALQGVTRK